MRAMRTKATQSLDIGRRRRQWQMGYGGASNRYYYLTNVGLTIQCYWTCGADIFKDHLPLKTKYRSFRLPLQLMLLRTKNSNSVIEKQYICFFWILLKWKAFVEIFTQNRFFFRHNNAETPPSKAEWGVLTLKGMIFKFASVRIFLTAIEKALNDINLTTRLLSWLGQAKAIIKVLIFEQPLTTLWHGVVS